jgi:hypothetical protein
MKLGIRTILIGVVILLLGYVAYSRRFDMSAAVWHWRNGDFVRVGKYEMPVPGHWLVKVVEPSGLTFLTDIRSPRKARASSSVNVIMIDSLPMSTRDLDSWKSYKKQWLKKNGISNPEERSLSFEDEDVACLGGEEFHQVMKLPDSGDVVSVDCLSSSRLHLMFVGQRPDLELFYSLVPKIRKQK